MKSSAFCAALLLAIFPALDAPYRAALPGYRYEFPRDFFAHPEFQTEWWYTTGNVKTADGRSFGFELTFFRQAESRDEAKRGAWDLRDIYLAHLALSDLGGGRFYHSERINRGGPGIAGINPAAGKVWNGNWFTVWNRNGSQQLAAHSGEFQFDFTLKPEKAPVIHGENGVSQKAEGAGHASHYFSQTRLATTGTIVLQGRHFAVSGLSWMDHEFFTHQLAADQTGWDWFSIQLEDKTELMLFILRRRDGLIDTFSAGTYVDAAGKATHLRATEFSLTPTGTTWKSAQTGASYPIAWNIAVPKMAIALSAGTKLPPQELTATPKLAPAYWEGSMEFSGTCSGKEIRGVGYLEMTGYDHPLQWTE